MIAARRMSFVLTCANWIGVFILLCVPFAAPAATAQTATQKAIPGIVTMDSLVAAEFARDSVGSITAGIVSGSDLVWTKSFGFANMGSRRLADRRTVYRIGSVTKMFTATMLLQLVNAGRVKLSDPVARFYPDIRRLHGTSGYGAGFTFLQLATMTAGLAPEPHAGTAFDIGPVSEWEKSVRTALPQTDLAHLPGTYFAYSNIGYAVLGAALGTAARTPYIEWQRTRVLDPLGMHRTQFQVNAEIASDLATGYVVGHDGQPDTSVSTRELSTGRGYRVPNGGIFTTIDDLSRFLSFELGRGPESVLPHSVLDSAYAGVIATSADEAFGYGLGFMLQHRDDFPYLGHSGGVPGYQAVMYFDRDHQLGVILMRNATGGKTSIGRVAPDMLKALILAKIAAEKGAGK